MASAAVLATVSRGLEFPSSGLRGWGACLWVDSVGFGAIPLLFPWLSFMAMVGGAVCEATGHEALDPTAEVNAQKSTFFQASRWFLT